MNAEHYRFSYLLMALGLMLLIQPFVQDRPFAAETINISFSITLLSSIYAVAQTRQSLFIAGILGFTTLLFHWLSYFSTSLLDPILTALSAIAFFAYCTFLLLANFFQRQRISSDTLCGAIAVYLLLGILCSFIHHLISLNNPAAYSLHLTNNTQFTDFIYFSFVTLSTLGYGDITPLSAAARTLTYMEAIGGQIYLAVIIAKLIGIHLSNALMEKNG